MKYLIGKLSTRLQNGFKTRYANCRIIEADSEHSAIAKYKSSYVSCYASLIVCIGIVDDSGSLLIYDYHKKYDSAKQLRATTNNTYNYMVTRLLDSMKALDDFSFYIIDFVQATDSANAVEIYNRTHLNSRYPAHCIGFVDHSGTFIVPNITNYIIN